MTDYGKGQVLGASVLPATSAAGAFFADLSNPVVLTGFIVLNVLWLVLLAGQISRFLSNRAK
jgi:hypothetical protein